MNLEPIGPSRAFRGVNIMTQEIVAYYRGALGGRVVHVELSKETPPYWSQTVERDPAGGPLWGVTIKRPDGSLLDPDPSKVCHSEEETRAYLEALS